MKKTPNKHNDNIESIRGLVEYYDQFAEILNQHTLISITDAKGNVLVVNDKFCEVSGFSREEILGSHYNAFRSDMYTPEFMKEVSEVITAGKTWSGIVQSKCKDGSFYCGNATVTPILDENGKPYQFISVNTDITELKQTQQRLEERTEELQFAQEMTGLCRFEIDMATRIIKASENFYEIYAFDPDRELTIEAVNENVHPADRAIIEKVHRQVSATNGAFDFTYRLLFDDHTIRHIHVVGRAELGDNGSATRIFGTLQDITPWVELNEKLSDTERRLTIAVESAGDGVWECKLDEKVVECTPLCATMLDYPEDKLSWPIEEWYSLVHPDDLPVVAAAVEKYRSGETDEYNIQVRVRCGNGEYKWISSRGKVVQRDEHKNPLRLIGINNDISAMKRQEAELIAARNEADQANKAKSDFLSNMSHELRTPLNAIIGFGQILELEDALGAEQVEYAHQIVKAGEHLTLLISEILDLAKVESGRLAVSIESVFLKSLVDDISPLFMQLASDNNISIDLSRVDNIAVAADRVRLKQILLNLVSNAIKYNRENGHVNVYTVMESDSSVRVVVEDAGRGIPPEQLESIFEPFNRLAAEGSFIEGTGIGLTLTKSLAEMMGGAIGVDSAPGVGSRFWVAFPISQID